MDLRTGLPFWLAAPSPAPPHHPLTKDEPCEVAVIGGGITGAMVAYHLAEAGVDTIVLDKRDIGSGSTSASTALLLYEIDVPLAELVPMIGEDRAVRAYRACCEAIDKIEAIVARRGLAGEIIRDLFLGRRNDDAELFVFDRRHDGG